MKKRKVSHQRQDCIGCNSCVTIAPQSWIMDKSDGKARLVNSKEKGKVFVGDIFEFDEEINKIAAEACPVQIIRLE